MTRCYVTKVKNGEGFRLHIFVKDKDGEVVELIVRFMKKGKYINNYTRLVKNNKDYYDKFGRIYDSSRINKATIEGKELQNELEKKTHLGLDEFTKDEFIKFVKNILEIWKGQK